MRGRHQFSPSLPLVQSYDHLIMDLSARLCRTAAQPCITEDPPAMTLLNRGLSVVFLEKQRDDNTRHHPLGRWQNNHGAAQAPL